LEAKAQGRFPSYHFLTALVVAILLYFAYAGLASLFPDLLHKHLVPLHGFEAISFGFINLSVLYCIVLTFFFAKFQKEIPFKDYFVLNRVPLKTLLLWVIGLIVFTLVISYIRYGTKLPLLVWWETELYQATHSKFLLIASMVIAAPLLEELFFRGFVFTAMLNSGLGRATTVLLTTYLWAIPLNQYGVYHTITIFFFGLLLALARLRTNSIVTPLIMHFIYNLVEVVIVFGFLSQRPLIG